MLDSFADQKMKETVELLDALYIDWGVCLPAEAIAAGYCCSSVDIPSARW